MIVDAAPTGETMRLLTMPESFQWYVGRLRGWGDTTLKIASGLLSRIVPEKDLLTGLNNLIEGVKELQTVLTDPEVTSYRIVLNPEKMVLKEGARALPDPVALWLSGGRGGGESHFARRGERRKRQCKRDGPSSDPYLRHLQEIQACYLGEIERGLLPAADSAFAGTIRKWWA